MKLCDGGVKEARWGLQEALSDMPVACPRHARDMPATCLQLLELVQELLVRDFLLFKRLQKLRILLLIRSGGDE